MPGRPGRTHPPLANRPARQNGARERHSRFDPVSAERRLPRRPADDPHVRRDAAARDRGLHLAHRRPLGALGRRLGSRLPRRDLGRDRRHHRRAALPRPHELERGSRDPRPLYGPIAVWQGGLGIWGAIPAGVLVGAWIVRRSGNSVRLFMDACAPGLLLAQAIGRWGNWWNQELYGKHTTLPWGLEIHGKGAANTYHPTFLYEFLWDGLGVLVLLWVDRRFKLRRPALFMLYVAYYSAFRTYEETLRIDPSAHVGGQRLNFWVSLGCFVASAALFVWWQFLRKPSEHKPKPAKKREVPQGPKMAVPRGRVR